MSALTLVLVCLMLGASLSPAAAATARHLPGPATGAADPAVEDGTCPVNPDFPNVPEPHQHFRVNVATAHGPDATLVIDVCHVFSGALGGIDVNGTFTLSARQGTLTGTANGIIAHGASEFLGLTLSIASGTRGLVHASGQLSFQGCFPGFEGPMFDTSLTLTPPPRTPCPAV